MYVLRTKKGLHRSPAVNLELAEALLQIVAEALVKLYSAAFIRQHHDRAHDKQHSAELPRA